MSAGLQITPLMALTISFMYNNSFVALSWRGLYASLPLTLKYAVTKGSLRIMRDFRLVSPRDLTYRFVQGLP